MRHGDGILWEPLPEHKAAAKKTDLEPEDNPGLRLVYEGGWARDKMHGIGKKFYLSGDVYDG